MTNLGNGNSLSVNLSADKNFTGNLCKDNHLTSRLSIAKGDKGEDGYTPIKGVDYFTQEDIDSLKDTFSQIGHTHTNKIDDVKLEDNKLNFYADGELITSITLPKQARAKAICGEFLCGDLTVGEGIEKGTRESGHKWIDGVTPVNAQNMNEIEDKFYWDDNKGHYCIEENAPKIDLHTMDWTYTHNDNLPEDEISFIVSNYCQNNNISVPSYNVDVMRLTIKHNIPILDASINAVGEGDAFAYHGSGSVYFKTKKTNIVNDSPIPYLKEKGYFIIVTRPTPNIKDLPHLNKKYSLDTYMPTTYLECTNSPMQPSRLLLESDTVRYKPSVLETDTDYTIQFECKEKSDKKVKLNLGGAEKEVDVEVGLNHVSITTPSEIDTSLYKDRLFLSGVGNKVADVIVNKGEMNQYPGYFNGVQSVGELQGDGAYKIDIKTNEGFRVSVQTNNPLTKEDNLYWNKSNKRYEIDRNGVIEVPVVEGDVIDLPRLYQRDGTNINISTGNIKPAKTKIVYKDII